ncbi:cytochrome P450 [Dichomitus squalens LYAD-421 SS1]|uniref:cytochrome P450 n=1 Tax=Dichomitus squalens (strain LYAD-421) TaxID=732165 RepID=UPI0004415E4D|nr:cytochrome P450 [Dichomitus squalens LYAD-421 SS1]EJF62600.1 cytochrome P450 [Dichomitus squalens LYAD-421 SS1]
MASYLPTTLSSLPHLVPSTLVGRLALVICGLAVFAVLRRRSPSNLKYPPGPRGLPLIGNLHQLTPDAWFQFADYKEVYGPIVYLNLAGQNVVVLNTLKVAADLLDRRAAIYSSRPKFIVARTLLTEGLFFVFQGYSDLWRRMRRAAHEALHRGVVHDYHPTQTLEATILLKDMLTAPNDWEDHLERMAGSTILAVAYDREPLKNVADPSMHTLHNFTKKIVRAGYVDGYVVEFFPWVNALPASLAPWKREAAEWAPRFSKLFSGLYNDVKLRVLDGDTRPSFSASMVEKQIKYGLSDKETSWLVATISAAFETMSGTLTWFMLAMVLYPDVQRKAQAELDAIVGRSRLPSFEDFENLVYIRAIIKETLRWHPVGPLGMQHVSTEDDVYEGYFIPKGTICIPNIWAINRDPDMWGLDADQYVPERHIGPDGKLAPSHLDTKEEGHVTFGFGRRICVGRHVARNSLFISIAYLLWMFNIKPPLGPDGKEIECTEKGIDLGLVVRPQYFKHRFEPRFPDAVSVYEAHRELMNVN